MSGQDLPAGAHPSDWMLCKSRFERPPIAPTHGTQYNGARLSDTCFKGDRPHVFVIGDWGGVTREGGPPVPADQRSQQFGSKARAFIPGADDCAQQKVAAEMAKRAVYNPPDYILNVGDNFYWAGLDQQCGNVTYLDEDSTGQWARGFEAVYRGPNLEDRQWLGVLGNHDFGGHMFTAGWDQVIARTWSSSRWVTPALYWAVKVHYDDFSVDYYFADSNVWDAFEPDVDEQHNICSRRHNMAGASCGVQGPRSLEDCSSWFQSMWLRQMIWLEAELALSEADWQVVVTHFPPTGSWGEEQWASLSREHGIDLFITGHLHRQEVRAPNSAGNPLGPTAIVISGGGGGITSEGVPNPDGDDDEYGFMDMMFSKQEISIEAISHGGQTRSTTLVYQRPRSVIPKFI